MQNINEKVVEILKKYGINVGEGSGSETGYYLSVDVDISEEDYLILKEVFKKEVFNVE